MENRPPSDITGPVTPDERTYLVDTLKNTQATLHESVANLSDAQATYRTAPDRWSVTECLEHIALVEAGLFKGVQVGMQAPADPAKRTDITVSDVDVIKAMRSRKNTRPAPAGMEPTGRFGDAAGALTAFDQLRDAAIDFAAYTRDDLRTHYFINRVFGTIDVYQALLMMASHAERHRKQIEEIKADAGFPQ